MKRLFIKFKQLLGYKYYISCRTHIGYMLSGPFTLKQAKQKYRECKSWRYTDVEIVHYSHIIF